MNPQSSSSKPNKPISKKWPFCSQNPNKTQLTVKTSSNEKVKFDPHFTVSASHMHSKQKISHD